MSLSSLYLAYAGGAGLTLAGAAAGYYFYYRGKSQQSNAETRFSVSEIPTEQSLGPHRGWVSALTSLPASSPGGAILASGGYDMSIRFWRRTGSCSADGQPLLEVITGAGCANIVRSLSSFLWEGHATLITGESAFGGATTQFFDVSTARLVAESRGHSMAVLDLAFVPETSNYGTLFASCSPDKSLRIFEIPDGRPNSENLLNFAPNVACLEYSDRLLSVSSAPRSDGPLPVIACGSYDNQVLLTSSDLKSFLTLTNGEERHSGPVTRVRFDPKAETRLFSAGHDGNIFGWDTTTGQPFWNHKLESSISTMAISDEALLLTGSQDGAVRLWDPRSRHSDTVQMLNGHSDFVLSVAFSSDALEAYSGGKDRSLRCWDLRKGPQ